MEVLERPASADSSDQSEEADTPFDFPIQRITPAAGQTRPITASPRSVFELAERPVAIRIQPGMTAPPQPGRGAAIAHRTDGVTRCAGSQYPRNRWDLQREEKERLRRAKQRPPKRTKWRTRGKKLLAMIGEGDER